MDKKQLYKLVETFITGDGGVYYSGKNCRYVRNQLDEHSDFINFQAEILSEITEVRIKGVKQRGNRKPLVNLMTKTHPIYTTMRDRVYYGNYKSISSHFLKIIDWESLAYLFQDDGSNHLYQKDGNSYLDITLNLKRLSYGDQFLFKKVLKERFDLEFNIVGNKYHFLRLRTKDHTKFLNGVEKYIFPSFEYKLTCPNDWLRNADDEIVRPNRRLLETNRNV